MHWRRRMRHRVVLDAGKSCSDSQSSSAMVKFRRPLPDGISTHFVWKETVTWADGFSLRPWAGRRARSIRSDRGPGCPATTVAMSSHANRAAVMTTVILASMLGTSFGISIVPLAPAEFSRRRLRRLGLNSLATVLGANVFAESSRRPDRHLVVNSHRASAS